MILVKYTIKPVDYHNRNNIIVIAGFWHESARLFSCLGPQQSSCGGKSAISSIVPCLAPARRARLASMWPTAVLFPLQGLQVQSSCFISTAAVALLGLQWRSSLHQCRRYAANAVATGNHRAPPQCGSHMRVSLAEVGRAGSVPTLLWQNLQIILGHCI